MEKRAYRCPIGATLNVISGKWKPLILWELHDEPRRFTHIKRAVEGVTQKMLTQQLRELEADGLITRQVYDEMPLRVEYSITALGKTLFPCSLQWQNGVTRTTQTSLARHSPSCKVSCRDR